MARGGRRAGAGRKKKAQATTAAPATATPPAPPAPSQPAPVESAPPQHPLLAKCTKKEQAFLLALVNDPQRNQTKAYESVFTAKGDSARANAAKCLAKDHVKAAWAALNGSVTKVAIERAELTAQRVLEELRRLAFVDVTGVFDDAGNLKPFSAWTEEQRAALAGFEVIIKNAKAGDGETDTVHKIKMVSKEKALEMLAKHFKLLTEVVQVEGDWDTKAARLAAARKRA